MEISFSLDFLILANENTILEAEVRTLQRKLARRDNEILKQERELHKLRVGIPIFEICKSVMNKSMKCAWDETKRTLQYNPFIQRHFLA